MPTTNPRVNVTLSPSLDAMVAELAQLQRVSKSAVLRELLEASEPALAQALAMMRAANELSVTARKRVVSDMEATLREVERKADKAMLLAAGVTADLVAQAEAIKGRRPARGGTALRGTPGRSKAGAVAHGPKDPPPSKRGVKSEKRGGKP